MRRKDLQHFEIAGVLPVWKEVGPTSHDVVDMVRRVARIRQVGHTGTLDPAAEGLLVLCLGPYTKLVPYLTDTNKVYRGWFALGVETDTDDSDGKPIAVANASGVDEARVREAAARFVGEIEQIPPRFSAVKVGGKKLYEYARAEQAVVIEPRRVRIDRFEIGQVKPIELPEDFIERAHQNPELGKEFEHLLGTFRQVEFEVAVSSGTYVRSLARDLGRALGCGGFLLRLARTATGAFRSEQAVPMAALKTMTPEKLDEYLVRGTAVLDRSKYPVFRILPAYLPRLQKGQPLTDRMVEEMEEAAGVANDTVCAIADDVGGLLAMVRAIRFDALQRKNAYSAGHRAGFRPLRIFPNGLR
jgi:tRNA pseudouridine55 synthase